MGSSSSILASYVPTLPSLPCKCRGQQTTEEFLCSHLLLVTTQLLVRTPSHPMWCPLAPWHGAQMEHTCSHSTHEWTLLIPVRCTGWCTIHLRWYHYKWATRHKNRAKHRTLGTMIFDYFWEKRGGFGKFLKTTWRDRFPPRITSLYICALWHLSFDQSDPSTLKHQGI